MPGFLVHHQLLQLAQTYVHRVSDALQPSHPVIPFSFCLQSCSTSGSFQMSLFFTSGGQSLGASASASVIPMNIQGLFPLGLTGLTSLESKGLFRSLLQYHSLKASTLWHSAFFMVQFSHLYTTTGKTKAMTRQTFVSKVMSLLFNMLPRLVIAFLPMSTCLNCMATVTISSDYGA